MLFVSSLEAANYRRAIRIFLTGLGEITGFGRNILGG
jgi:hypothetical protein